MKRIRRQSALAKLYAGLLYRDYDEREFAIFQLALVLQRSHDDAAEPDAPDLYHENLTRDLLRIRMSPAEEREAAAVIAQLIAAYPESRASAFWASSHFSSAIGLPFVLAMTREYGDQLAAEAAYQACRALAQWLRAGGSTGAFIDEQLANIGPLECLEGWSKSRDDRLAVEAGRLNRLVESRRG